MTFGPHPSDLTDDAAPVPAPPPAPPHDDPCGACPPGGLSELCWLRLREAQQAKRSRGTGSTASG